MERYNRMIEQVVVFAGGKGTRLGSNTAKCLSCVCGKPILYYIVNEFLNQNVNKFHFCLGYYYKDILDWLNTQNIQYTYSLDPEENCGTWAALVNAKPWLDEIFFVTYGDSIAFCDLEFMYWQFIESGQDSMLSVSNTGSESSNFHIDGDGKIGSLYRNYVDHGISIMSKSCISEYVQGLSSFGPINLSIKNFSSFFLLRVGDSVHYANANYYQINTKDDLKYVNDEFYKFKTLQKYNFIDRDGTINKFDTEIYKKMNFEPHHEILSSLPKSNCVIITNQPAKVKNEAKLSQINIMNEKAREFLIKNGYNVLFTHSCLHKNVPYMNDVFDNLRFDCECRKPKTGMLDKASKRIQISPLSIFYGDSDCDEECANNFGLFFFRIY